MSKTLFSMDQVGRTNLAELAEVVGGGIVSKPLFDTGTVKQVLFAMDAGQSISEHRVPMAATVHVLDGRMQFRAGDEQHDMGPHEWLLMPPNTPHELRADQPVRFLLTLIKEA